MQPAQRTGGGGESHPECWGNSKGMTITAPWESAVATSGEFYHRSVAESTACFNGSNVIV